MKHLKMRGIAALAAAALMAFVGASSASATVLCKTPGTGTPTGTTCPSGWAYAGAQEIHSVNVGNVIMHTTYKTITWTVLTTRYSTSSEGSESEAVTGPEGELILGGGNCTGNVLKAGTQEIQWISGTHNGTVRSSGTEITTICSTIFGNVHCTYATNNTDFGTLTGGSPAMLTASANIPVNASESDGLCSEESTVTVTEKVTTPTPLYVTSHT